MSHRYSSTERIGVNATEALVVKELGWIFREQPIADMGIDAHIESVEEGNPTGGLIGVQIKTGSSHFTDNSDGLIYYGSNTHLEYWQNHSLPVILVAHLPETNATYWVHVCKENVEITKKNWKISIPKTQSLDKKSEEKLKSILEGTESEKKQRALSLDKPLMKKLEGGGQLFVYTEEWHNKSLGRGPIKIIYRDADGNETPEKEWHAWYTGYSLEELIQHYFPWADIYIDEEFYEENFCDSFYDVYTDWYKEINNIYPYEVVAGEISLYRLELKLNELGRSFILVSEYLDE